MIFFGLFFYMFPTMRETLLAMVGIKTIRHSKKESGHMAGHCHIESHISTPHRRTYHPERDTNLFCVNGENHNGGLTVNVYICRLLKYALKRFQIARPVEAFFG